MLLFDKPLELSSNDALQKVRQLFQAEKAGHTGTLDPLATGLLPVCFGEATKFSNALLDADKTYRALLRLGQTTTTGDAEGEIIAERPVEVLLSGIDAVLARFRGEIRQLPPMHSALKHQGKPLYEYIRKGETVERKLRSVVIHELILNSFQRQRNGYYRALQQRHLHTHACRRYRRSTRLRRTSDRPAPYRDRSFQFEWQLQHATTGSDERRGPRCLHFAAGKPDAGYAKTETG